MYTDHFGLQEEPFTMSPDPKFLFPSDQHQKALADISHGVSMRKGIITLVGKAGTGKTTLIRTLLKGLNGNTLSAWVFNTTLESEDLIRYICKDFGLKIKSKDKSDVLMELYRFLIANYEDGKNTILIVDEAQNIDPQVLEEIRQLTNIETTTSKLLQIILSGQPKLEKVLEHPDLLQLNQRVGVRAHLRPLSRDETIQYVQHRLHVAGASDVTVFKDDALDAIFNISNGIPRTINIICSSAMQRAEKLKTTTIQAQIVEMLCREGVIKTTATVTSKPMATASDKAMAKLRKLKEAKFMQMRETVRSSDSGKISELLIPERFEGVDLGQLAIA